jgi:hypothetical protein
MMVLILLYEMQATQQDLIKRINSWCIND